MRKMSNSVLLTEKTTPPLTIENLRYCFAGRTDPIFDGLELTVNNGNRGHFGWKWYRQIDSGSTDFDLSDARPKLEPFIFVLIGLIASRRAVFDHLSVRGNLSLPLSRMGRKTDANTIRKRLDQVNLNTVPLNLPAHALSGGQKRRLAVARALATEPKLLYFDEPSAGLDIDNVRDQGALIRTLCGTAEKSGVIVTHDPLLAAITADRVVLLANGQLTPLIAFNTRVPLKTSKKSCPTTSDRNGCCW